MVKKTSKLSAREVAEKAKPNWRVVPAPPAGTDAAEPPAKADATTPEVDFLLDKYFGRAKADSISKKKAPPAPKESHMVVMEPRTGVDARPGRKVMLVENGEVTGEQG